MTRTTLTTEEAWLLQRYVDDEASGEEHRRAEALLKELPAARVYVTAIEELAVATRAAAEAAWEGAHPPSAQDVVELARQWAGWAQAPLEEIAPLLERFHDGEVDPAEGAAVVALLEEREDVADYLAELDGLAAGIRVHEEAIAEADFSGFFDGIAAAIDAEEGEEAEVLPMDPFDAEEHLLLLHRFHDGECSAEECRRVQRWIDGGDSTVETLLGVMAELQVGVNAGIEMAQEEADFADLWSGMEGRLDEIDAEKAAPNVVSLPDRAAQTPGRSLFHQPVFALVATVVLILMGSYLGSQILQQETVVETRTVVIFDSVEYAPGSSVMIHNPQLASHEADEDDIPILWVLDDDDDDDWDDEDDFDDLPGGPGPI